MIIYLARNTLNGKVYIGQTVKSLRERMGDHRRSALVHGSRCHFHAAIRKYGFAAFEWKTLECVLLREALNPAERYWIRLYHSTDPRRGYNNTHGGDSFEFTEEAKRKIGLAGKGRRISEARKAELRSLMAGAGNPFHGEHHTEEAKAKNRAAHVGRKLRPEHIAKCIHRGETNGRATLTEEMVREIRKALARMERDCEIYRRMGISKVAFQAVKYRRTWRWVA